MERPFIPKNILDYCDQNSSALSAISESILATAGGLPRGHMMVGRHVARLLQCLTMCRQPSRVLEIGTFHGFSASAIAEVLPSSGKLICCERDAVVGSIASRNLAPYIERGIVEVVLFDGVAYLRTSEALFDLMFIDADKGAFCGEIDLIHDRLAANGLLIVDNAFAGLAVMRDEPEQQWERDTKQFNEALSADRRFLITQLPLRDGITLAVKR